MGFLRNIFLFIFVSTLSICNFSDAQVIFKTLPNYQPLFSDYAFFGVTQTRSIIPLNGNWVVYLAGEDVEKKVRVTVPSIFEGEGEFIFEREFRLTADEIQNNSFKLVFLGLNYRADISVNNVMIFRQAGGEFPFKIDLSRDILKSNSVNLLSVRLFYKLDSRNTIPLKQRFLFSKNYGGLIHDVYIYLTPDVNISNLDIKTVLNSAGSEANINLKSSVVNQELTSKENATSTTRELTLKAYLVNAANEVVYESSQNKFELKRNKEKTIDQTIKLKDPLLWSPDHPQSYKIRIELRNGDELTDVIERSLAVYSFKVNDDSLTLNGRRLTLDGVTYIPEYRSFGDLMNYDQFEKDIKIIKQAGFNAVRISKVVPHPYILELCEKYGLLAFIELPVAMIPADLSRDQNFVIRCRDFLSSYFKGYKKYSAVVAIGLGGNYLMSIDSHRSLLSNLAEYVKQNTGWVTYASFGSMKLQKIENLDLYGLELLNELPADHLEEINQTKNELGAGRVFISEATYSVNKGNTDGYVNKYSYEAQAKYFADLIDYCRDSLFTGYFINSMFDIRGDYSSLISGYSSDNLYNIGLAGENRSTNRLGFKVVSSKLNETEKVTIPIGSPKDDAPMVFILFGLVLAVLMGVLVNSGRKFREDASRALLRPYNFFADVRDQRIMSAYHTSFLAFIVISVNALVISNLLYFLRTNVIFEKLLISFGSPLLIKIVNYLCWFPFKSIIWLMLIGVLFSLFIILIIKATSLFVRTKVFLSSIFFTVVWAMLPLVFLIPIGIVLYRVLVADIVNVYLYLLLIIFAIWVLHRLLKGIYVIFDANPGSVYFYSALFLLVLVGGIMFYFELKDSTIEYILFTIKQYNLLG